MTRLLNYWWWRRRRRRLAVVDYAPRVLALTPVAYYKLAEASGTAAIDSSGNGDNGTYINAVPGGTGIGDGNTGATFDGTGDAIDIIDGGALFIGNTGSVVLWGKTTTAVWSDATTRYLIRLAADSSNLVAIRKTATTNQLELLRIAGGTTKSVTSTVLSGTEAPFSVALTWDTGANAVKAYAAGVQIGTTQSAIGSFSGALATAAIGALNIGGASSWNGSIAHVALFDYALSDAEVLSLGVL